MKKLFLLLVAPCVMFSTLSAQITQKEADEIVQQRLDGEEKPCTVYAKEAVQTEGFTVITATGETLELAYPCWVYYVDYAGETNGKYLIVKENNGNLLEVKTKKDTGPGNLMEWRVVTFETETIITITPDKVWYIESGYACPEGDDTGCFCYYGLITIKTGEVKTFNGKEYYELLTDAPNQQWNVVTYVREEDRKVFFYVEDCDKEYLMYDFNLEEGDEVVLVDPHFPYSVYGECELMEEDMLMSKFKVIEVGEIEYNRVTRKMMRLKHHFSDAYDIWVEGIGCIRGITFRTLQMSGAKQLRDCYDLDELIFVNEDPEFCWVY